MHELLGAIKLVEKHAPREHRQPLRALRTLCDECEMPAEEADFIGFTELFRMKPYMIAVRVPSGFTGTRVILLKDANGALLDFETRAEAQTKRDAYPRFKNRLNGTARFNAWVVERSTFAEWNAQEITRELLAKF